MTIALGVYRHSKGNLYEVTAIAKDATNGGNAGLPCVVYRSEKTGDVFIRDLDQFIADYDTVIAGKVATR